MALMGPESPKPATRRRGRPRKEVKPEDDVEAEDRRARNRRNQLVFRTRRQAEQKSREEHTRKLETTVAQMNSELLAFASQAFASEIFSRDQQLVQRLQATVRRTSLLAAAAVPASADSSVEDDANETHFLGREAADWAESPSVKGCDALDWQSGALELASPSESKPAADDLVLAEASSHDFVLSPNIFGNGWLGRVPTFLKDQDLSHIPGVTAHPLGIRLVHTVLQVGLYALLGAFHMRPDAIERIFGYSFRYHSKQELLFNIRWFLGPGYTELYRLGNASFRSSPLAHLIRSATPKELGALDQAVDRDAIEDFGSAPSDDGPTSGNPFLNANEVDVYLRAMGASDDGPDVMRLTIPMAEVKLIPEHGGQRNDPLHEAEQTRGMRDPFNLEQLLGCRGAVASKGASKEHGITSGLVIKVSRTQLIMNLVSISVCLANGPGFRHAWLIQALLAASIVE